VTVIFHDDRNSAFNIPVHDEDWTGIKRAITPFSPIG
jgi:hypothetical protein